MTPEQESDRTAKAEPTAYGHLISEVTYHHFCHIPRVSRPTLVPSVSRECQEAALGLVTPIANMKIEISSRKIYIWAKGVLIFVRSFNRLLLSTSFVLVTVLGAENTTGEQDIQFLPSENKQS